MKKSNSLAKKLAIISGLLLLLSGGSGVAAIKMLAEILFSIIPENKLLIWMFTFLIIIASFGGITVMIGGFLIGKHKVTLGRILIQLGSGMGVLGLLLMILVAIINGRFIMGSFFSIGTLGVTLSVIAVLVSKKPKKKKKNNPLKRKFFTFK